MKKKVVQPTLSAFFKRSAPSTSVTEVSETLIEVSSKTTTTATVESTEVTSITNNSSAESSPSPSKRKQARLSGTEVVVEEENVTLTVATTKQSKAQFSTLVNKSNVTWADQEIDRLEDEKWKAILTKEASKSRPLFTFLNGLPDSRILPPKNKVFEAFRLCPFDDVRVVILGQDPYHGPGQAHGLAFSVMKGVQVPPSLRNIYKEAANDVGAKSGQSGYLECWAKQGVLLLNALLTVEPGKPMAHKGRGWEKFTDACIAALSKERENLVFLLWGKPAQEKGKIVDRSKHLVITSSHPSPLGASQTAEPFLGSKCFSRCNAYLKKNGLGEINWNVVD